MAQWATFAGVTGVVLVLLLALSHLTQSAFSDDDSTASGGTVSDTDAASSRSASASSARGDASPPESTTDDASEPDLDRRDSSGDTDAGTGIGSDSDGSSGRNAPSSGDVDRTAAAERAAENGVGQSPESATRSGSEFGTRSGDRPRQGVDPQSLSPGELLANVALSQGLFASVLLGAVLYTGIPVDALGIEFSTAYLLQGLAWGTAAGLVLYAANEVGAAAATHLGFDHDEQLRTLLAPDTARGWLVLLAFVLPLIAGFEELLFRAALIGALSAGFGVDPWLLAVVSSIAFAIGHGMQGSVGIVVTGLLGFVLAAIFVVTGSLLVVVVAHYLINALEFAVHEGLEFDWAETLES
ncbi:type II CAAX endopeptidase family protein [Haloterrigena salinisoli]|uniref:CPBP family intramembrane glutamic endopeptidase n=1 Tax=Haloterrigena salinisoli TaxID=3132747 RepID=UPI0030CE660D